MFIIQHWGLWLVGTIVSTATGTTAIIMFIGALKRNEDGLLPLGIFLFCFVVGLVFLFLLTLAGIASVGASIAGH